MRHFIKTTDVCIWIFILLLIPSLSSCVVQKTVTKKYSSLKHSIQGGYYFDKERYQDGINVFTEEVINNPASPKAHYFLGRFQLAENLNKQALIHLKEATVLAPDEADYYFWLGVAYAANNNKSRERKSYGRALEIDGRHVQALTYLGHIQLESREYHTALQTYTRVIELQSDNPSALYNRALALRLLSRTPEEKQAWKEYLAVYPAGPFARQATVYLNAQGDFDYRNYTIGFRSVTLRKILFKPSTSELVEGSALSLQRLGSILKKDSHPIHIIVYQKDNKDLARERAKYIKQYLIEACADIPPSRLKISWFDKPEKITIGKKVFWNEESINFFTAVEAG